MFTHPFQTPYLFISFPLLLHRVYDVAVVDEIQMIGDMTRGHAWTRAFLGLQANEVHVCGSLEAEQLVRSLCATTGDDFEVRKM
jgi:ATP-dependent RNA helicase SUPV3L1/SUV3